MFKQPLWIKKYKEDVEDQITITGGPQPSRMMGGPPPTAPIAPADPISYSTGAGPDGQVQPNRRAMLDLTEFHEGEEVIPYSTVKDAGGNENVKRAVANEVILRSYASGGTVDRKPEDPMDNPINTKSWGAPQAPPTTFKQPPNIALDKPQQMVSSSTIKPPKPESITPDRTTQSIVSGPINNSQDNASGYKNAAQSSIQASKGASAGASAAAAASRAASKAASEAASKGAAMAARQNADFTPIKKIELPEFKKTDLDSKITVDPTIKVDPKYKRNIDQAISQEKSIASGDSEAAKTIANRALQQQDAGSQTNLNLLKMQIANNPNMTEGQKRTAIASAMRDAGSQRSNLIGGLAESNMNRAEQAIGKVSEMSGAQQAYEAANQKFQISQETANQMFEKNFDYTQELNNNVHEYAASKDRFDFEYKTTVDQANAALQAGDYSGANKAYANLGFNIDFSKAAAAEQRQIESEKLGLELKNLDVAGAKQALETGALNIDSIKQALELGKIKIKGAEQDIELGTYDIEKAKQDIESGKLNIEQLNQAIKQGDINLSTLQERSNLEMESLRAEAASRAEQKIGDAMGSLATSIANGGEFEDDLVQHDMKRAYEAIHGEGTATGAEFEKWAQNNYDSVKTKMDPIYGPISNLDDKFIENMFTSLMKTEDNPDWKIDDFTFGTAKGIDAAKEALGNIMMFKGFDPETMQGDLSKPVWGKILGYEGADGKTTEDKTFDLEIDDAMSFKAEDIIKAGPEGNEESYNNAVRANIKFMQDSKDYSDLKKYSKDDPYYKSVYATAKDLDLETKFYDRGGGKVDHWKFNNSPEVGDLIKFNGVMYQVAGEIYADRKKGGIDTQTIPVIDPQTGDKVKIGISKNTGKVGLA